MDKVEHIACDEGYERISLDCWPFNENALEMYRHIGYKEQRIVFEKSVC